MGQHIRAWNLKLPSRYVRARTFLPSIRTIAEDHVEANLEVKHGSLDNFDSLSGAPIASFLASRANHIVFLLRLTLVVVEAISRSVGQC